MSEELYTDYKDGDIVWVKLGPSWWPGEVRDLNNIPSDEIEFKKPPLAVVKFFEEDAYEYVKTWTNIYPYNCDKKSEFIKKGMAAFRSKAPHMEKFPRDVTTAESKIGGNPNILSDPACVYEKKRNIAAEIFGSPNAKKSPRDSNKKPRSSLKHNPKDNAHLTHRRFLGVDDYKAYICIQYPGKDRIPGDSEDEEVIRINTEREQEYNCHSCAYTTRRLEVMILHTKSHIQGVYVSSPGRKRPAARPRKKEYTKKKAKTYSDDSSSEDVPEPPKEKKRKTKVDTKPKKLPKTVVEEVKPKSVEDIRTDLLAEWEDSDDEFDMSIFDKTPNLSESFDVTGVSKLDDTADLSNKESDTEMNETKETENGDNETKETENGDNEPKETENGDNEPKETENGDNETKETENADSETKEIENGNNDTKSMSDIENEPLISPKEPKDTYKPQMDKETQEAIKSCFDFDEDDEDDDFLNTTVEVGRKIPRVIPPTEKRKSEILEDIIDLEEGINKDEILKVSQSFNEKTATKESQELENTFKDLMDTTSVPRLPNIENSLKPTQNFHVVTTIKFPDKPDESPKKDREKQSTDIPINPKKRFVKSFEDFENQLQQEENRRKEEEQLKKREIRETLKETQVNSDKNEDPNQVFQEAKSSFFNEMSSLDQVTAVTPNQDSIIEENIPMRTNEYSSSGEDDAGIDFNKLQTTIMSKIMEEAKMSNESRNKILSKMKNKTPTRSNRLSESDESVSKRRYSSRKKERKSPVKDKLEEKNEESYVPKGLRHSKDRIEEEIVPLPSVSSKKDSSDLEKVVPKRRKYSAKAPVEEESILSVKEESISSAKDSEDIGTKESDEVTVRERRYSSRNKDKLEEQSEENDVPKGDQYSKDRVEEIVPSPSVSTEKDTIAPEKVVPKRRKFFAKTAVEGESISSANDSKEIEKTVLTGSTKEESDEATVSERRLSSRNKEHRSIVKDKHEEQSEDNDATKSRRYSKDRIEEEVVPSTLLASKKVTSEPEKVPKRRKYSEKAPVEEESISSVNDSNEIEKDVLTGGTKEESDEATVSERRHSSRNKEHRSIVKDKDEEQSVENDVPKSRRYSKDRIEEEIVPSSSVSSEKSATETEKVVPKRRKYSAKVPVEEESIYSANDSKEVGKNVLTGVKKEESDEATLPERTHSSRNKEHTSLVKDKLEEQSEEDDIPISLRYLKDRIEKKIVPSSTVSSEKDTTEPEKVVPKRRKYSAKVPVDEESKSSAKDSKEIEKNVLIGGTKEECDEATLPERRHSSRYKEHRSSVDDKLEKQSEVDNIPIGLRYPKDRIEEEIVPSSSVSSEKDTTEPEKVVPKRRKYSAKVPVEESKSSSKDSKEIEKNVLTGVKKEESDEATLPERRHSSRNKEHTSLDKDKLEEQSEEDDIPISLRYSKDRIEEEIVPSSSVPFEKDTTEPEKVPKRRKYSAKAPVEEESISSTKDSKEIEKNVLAGGTKEESDEATLPERRHSSRNKEHKSFVKDKLEKKSEEDDIPISLPYSKDQIEEEIVPFSSVSSEKDTTEPEKIIPKRRKYYSKASVEEESISSVNDSKETERNVLSGGTNEESDEATLPERRHSSRNKEQRSFVKDKHEEQSEDNDASKSRRYSKDRIEEDIVPSSSVFSEKDTTEPEKVVSKRRKYSAKAPVEEESISSVNVLNEIEKNYSTGGTKEDFDEATLPDRKHSSRNKDHRSSVKDKLQEQSEEEDDIPISLRISKDRIEEEIVPSSSVSSENDTTEPEKVPKRRKHSAKASVEEESISSANDSKDIEKNVLTGGTAEEFYEAILPERRHSSRSKEHKSLVKDKLEEQSKEGDTPIGHRYSKDRIEEEIVASSSVSWEKDTTEPEKLPKSRKYLEKFPVEEESISSGNELNEIEKNVLVGGTKEESDEATLPERKHSSRNKEHRSSLKDKLQIQSEENDVPIGLRYSKDRIEEEIVPSSSISFEKNITEPKKVVPKGRKFSSKAPVEKESISSANDSKEIGKNVLIGVTKEETDEATLPERTHSSRNKEHKSLVKDKLKEQSEENDVPMGRRIEEKIVPSISSEQEKIVPERCKYSAKAPVEEESTSSANDSNIEKNVPTVDTKEEKLPVEEKIEERSFPSRISFSIKKKNVLKSTIFKDWDDEDEPFVLPIRRSLRSTSQEATHLQKPKDINKTEDESVKERDIIEKRAMNVPFKKSRWLRRTSYPKKETPAESFKIDPAQNVSLPVKIDKKLVFDITHKDDLKSVSSFLENEKSCNEETEYTRKNDLSEEIREKKIELASNDYTTVKESTPSDFTEEIVATEEIDATKEIDDIKDATKETDYAEEIVTTKEVAFTEELTAIKEITPTDEEIAHTEEIVPTEEIAATEEIAFPEEEIATTKEIVTAEEEIATTKEIVAIEQEIVTTDEIAYTEEEIAHTEVEITSIKEEIAPTEEIIRTEEEIAPTEETARTEEEIAHIEEIAHTEEEITHTEKEISPTEEEISCTLSEIAPIEEIAHTEEIIPTEEEIAYTEEEITYTEIAPTEEIAAETVSEDEKSEADPNVVSEPAENYIEDKSNFDKDDQNLSDRLSNCINEEFHDVTNDIVVETEHEEFPPVAAALPEDAICEPVSKPNKRKKGRRRSSRFTARKKRKVSRDSEQIEESVDNEAETENGSLPEEPAENIGSLPEESSENIEERTVPTSSENYSNVTEEETNLKDSDSELIIDTAHTEIDAVEEETIFEVTIEQDSSKSHVDTDTEIIETEEIVETCIETELDDFASEIQAVEESQEVSITTEEEAIRHPEQLEIAEVETQQDVSSDVPICNEEAVATNEREQILVSDELPQELVNEIPISNEEEAIATQEHVFSDVLASTEDEALTTPENLEIEKVVHEIDVPVSIEEELVVTQTDEEKQLIISTDEIPLPTEEAVVAPKEHIEAPVKADVIEDHFKPIKEQIVTIEKEAEVVKVPEGSVVEELVTEHIEADEKITEEVTNEIPTRKLEQKASTTKHDDLINSLFSFTGSKFIIETDTSTDKIESTEKNKIGAKKFLDTMDDDDDDNDNFTDLVSDIVQKLKQDSDKNRDLEMDNLQDSPEKITDKTKILDDADDEKAKLEILCESSSQDAFKFSIQTNLSNLSRSEEISAIALATLSEMKTDLDSSIISTPRENLNFPEKLSETEMVAIESNLTVMSEKDLADAQVEITTDKVISSKKPVTLSNFSLDFSDSTSDSGSLTEPIKFADFDSKGTEFTSRAITKELKPKSAAKRANAYDQCELLDILEGNTEGDKKIVEFQTPTKTFSGDIMDFEECIPSQIVCTKEFQKNINDELKKKDKSSSVMSTTSKLLERLTDTKHLETKTELPTESPVKVVKNQKIKSKPIILSEQIIKPAAAEKKKVALTNNTVNDIEDVEAFVIHKDLKKTVEEEEPPKVIPPPPKAVRRPRNKPTGKAKILQQTIITPAGEIIQPAVGAAAKKKAVTAVASITRITPESLPSILSNNTSKPSTTTVISNATVDTTNQDDNIFDIFNMPIVLSDQILTPESIENMPIVIDGNSPVNKPTPTVITPITTKIPTSKVVTKTISSTTPTLISTKLSNLTPKQKPRILQSAVARPSLASAVVPQKPGKYIIVSQGSPAIAPPKIAQKKVMKRASLPAGIAAKVGNTQEITGNKIMVVTNQQGQQQRLLLTPAQQKVLGYQPPSGPKITKTVVKTNLLQKSIAAVSKTEAGSSKTSSLLGQKIVATTSQFLSTTSGTFTSKPIKTAIKSKLTQNQKASTSTSSKSAKTILITNKHGQTIKKIATTEDDIDKQVAEQLEAIKASSGMQFGTQPKPEVVNNKPTTPKPPIRKPYFKKQEPKTKLTPPVINTESSKPPPLATASKKALPALAETKKIIKEEPKLQPERPLNQLVIQDALGNQTTITEGQILAIPSETVDGQPQSYMLVTLDQAGNLTPLNNEALMSLDPNLGLGGDLSNMVLQIDQGSMGSSVPLAQPATVKLTSPGEELQAGTSKIDIPRAAAAPLSLPVANDVPILEPKVHPSVIPAPAEASVNIESIVSNSSREQGQQLIVTGDPIATQKFLESLTEGTTDLANIIANAEGKSILIQADGQQILINTNTDSRLLPNVAESTEGGGNPIFATQPNKNTDILAAALADTDVFTTQPKISQLSPNNALYPMNVGNVLETSLTLNSPIMTPLEVPSTNSKKIPDDEADILIQVPKNVDLPITITDPNISQTVANQQAANLMASELGLGISETTISSSSTGLTSPSYSYALAALDESDMSHKSFSSSMPLLNDDVEESTSRRKSQDKDDDKTTSNLNSEGFLEEESRFTLGGGMCSSLSEPPPEMFDIPDVNSYGEKNGNNIPLSLRSTPDSKDDDTTDVFSNQAESSSEGSCEIPVQPKIVAKAADLPDGSEM